MKENRATTDTFWRDIHRRFGPGKFPPTYCFRKLRSIENPDYFTDIFGFPTISHIHVEFEPKSEPKIRDIYEVTSRITSGDILKRFQFMKTNQ